MSLAKFETDMNIISKLDDEPNDVGGLSSAELKAKFDEGGLSIQKYINNILLPNIMQELENLTEGAAGGYYIPSVEQLSETQVRISFTPSKEDMEEVTPVIITLTAGPAGMSAYEAARKGGYTGTEEAFYAALAAVGNGETGGDDPVTPSGNQIYWFLEDETDYGRSGKYSAKEGMTWAEFVDSVYNFPGLKLASDGYVTAGHDTSLNAEGYNAVRGTDVIEAEATYYLSY